MVPSQVVALSPGHARFVQEYLRDFNATQAMVRAGYSLKSAQVDAYRMLKMPRVADAVLVELERRRSRAEATLEEVITFHHELATADPRRLTPFKYGACRYCWGEDHSWHYTRGELRESLRQYQMQWNSRPHKPGDKMPPFDIKGGDGYDMYRDPMRGPTCTMGEPNSDHTCPECHGAGEVRLMPLDLQNLSYGETLLYNGVRFHKDGSFQIMLNNRAASMDRVAELRGFVRPRLPVRDFNWDRMSDEELDAAVDEALRRGLVSQKDIEATTKTIEGEAVDVTPREQVE